MNEDTVAAIATALGEGSIAVVRVSGPEAVETVAKLFKSKQDLREADTHTVQYGWIVDPQSDRRIDEVLVTIMKGPRSFTAEDVVEISTHGGIVAVKSVLELVLRHGVRLAEPGEFTKRAFLNGRIDLAQAEAVIDLIRSKSDRAFQVARRQAEGSVSKKIVPLRQQLIELIAHVEVNIDYPEHDVEDVTAELIRSNCRSVLAEVNELLQRSNEGKILREGIVTAIVGRPNAGKSSLLNALARENKAIVTDIPGTTRDIVEETVSLSGIPLRLLDTAGIRETEDLVEQIGVERSHDALNDADLILLVLNRHEELHDDERKLLQQLKDRSTIVVVNKIDLPAQLEMEEIERDYPSERIVYLSAKEGQGIEQLEKAVSGLFFSGAVESGDITYVSNARHIALLHQTRQSLEDAIQATYEGVPIDLIQIDITASWESLGQILGDAAGDSLLDQIFSQFCLGK
ncbi:tRNA uridine-5-carboxymethylaminomethyl(34) synthesis GTPase MnmE [Cohnella sp. CIP 111063]|uniref:tRNA uridine-5-carboxymethylaminomethyl(34) synthesis GTPase MnmE n=1 Tax=unclassified Cohnella TaxID=2636738 RepID=UPI000B8BE89F|nr:MULTISPECIES: tRNA uridine-5-carboxymethylaminomethyl(34) synthesis GTPase MnmE [unclassified Cohnella]OXS56661.1 tRNA uridine-5-carboxymethylaminomethyl(34) synthesis GTPase MnmE [Cohnella sp. CIP 111063]PRX68858.1 tRNA modification GTPase trmE [Cohnella sp. SGD-V74]